MKLILCLLLTCSSIQLSAKTKISISQTCDLKTLPLFLIDGDFTQEQKYRLPRDVSSYEDLENFLLKITKSSLEQKKIKQHLDKVLSVIASGVRKKTRAVLSEDLLIDLTSSCQYHALSEFSDKKQFLISKDFDLLTMTQKMYYILEALSFPNIDKYSDVGNRNYIYAQLEGNYINKSDKEIVQLKKEAGYTVFYKDKSLINLNNSIFYHDDTDSIEIAYLEKGSSILTPGGICYSSDIRPALFDKNGVLLVFTISNPCKLQIGNTEYIARAQSVMKLTNEAELSNESIPLMVEWIYVQDHFKINNSKVDLIASDDPLKKSKLIFSTNGSGKVSAYIQFKGQVNYRGKFYKIKDYFNLYEHSQNSDFIASMTLDEAIKVNQAGQTNHYNSLIQLSEAGHLLTGTIQGKTPKLKIGSQLIDIMPETRVLFFYDKPERVASVVLRYPTKLLTVNGEVLNFPPGQELYLTPQGLVK